MLWVGGLHHSMDWRIYNALPLNVAQMIFGAALCYFGGTFVTTIAAAEAFRTMGYEKAAADVKALWAEIKPVLDKNAEDDLVDDDGDGISDVDQITPPELLQRKAFLVVTTVKHPERIQSAMGSIYAGLVSCPCDAQARVRSDDSHGHRSCRHGQKATRTCRQAQDRGADGSCRPRN